eukprot:TRINITY_DN12315_c0_g1_i1.p1 TRINITY_DN12315_c0_g1~~TRINITY_DN12315_c0_g1_i1.p1  ORF type:complete len:163 (-),score=39.75 TRINITY_DN12315_c0_g1_i1:41-529(-)
MSKSPSLVRAGPPPQPHPHPVLPDESGTDTRGYFSYTDSDSDGNGTLEVDIELSDDDVYRAIGIYRILKEAIAEARNIKELALRQPTLAVLRCAAVDMELLPGCGQAIRISQMLHNSRYVPRYQPYPKPRPHKEQKEKSTQATQSTTPEPVGVAALFRKLTK